MNYKVFIAALFIIFQVSCSSTKQLDTAKESDIPVMVQQQEFIFKAQNALPMGGPTRQLTSEYDLIISKDSIISYLPYFGRSFTAPLDPRNIGIQFTSTDFIINAQPASKDVYRITIRPSDYPDVREMNLSITSSGYASLQVSFRNRQAISFNGVVVARQ